MRTYTILMLCGLSNNTREKRAEPPHHQTWGMYPISQKAMQTIPGEKSPVTVRGLRH